MGHQWIIDVIVDLKTFAQQNELKVLAEELAIAEEIAWVEIDSNSEGLPLAGRSDQSEFRRVFPQA